MTQIKKKLDELIAQKLVHVKRYPELELNVYKYANTVFFNNLWNKSPYLLKARGLVLDNAGNIVQHPFDKVFNFNENGTGSDIALDKKVVAVEKLNGFLACITKYHNKNELLVSTTGSLDSDFVKMIHELITPEQRENMLSYFQSNNETLMFEAIHPQDPHIISYAPEEQGLWLIGARAKDESSPTKSEQELDHMAKQLKFKRPAWFEATFEDMIKRIKTDKIEGYMILDAATARPLLKMKTDYYLVTKFIARMGVNNINLMYDNTRVFKDKVEEEFYELVDKLISSYNKETLLSFPKDHKVQLVRGMIENLNMYRKKN